jgi:hypothetical protein
MDAIDKAVDLQQRRGAVERDEGWRDWLFTIPEIPVQPGWRVRPLPPYAGALARFSVVNTRGEFKSVLLDAWDRFNVRPVTGPYWEVSPVDGEPAKCDMADVDELVRLIEAPRGDRGVMVDRFTGQPVAARRE